MGIAPVKRLELSYKEEGRGEAQRSYHCLFVEGSQRPDPRRTAEWNHVAPSE